MAYTIKSWFWMVDLEDVDEIIVKNAEYKIYYARRTDIYIYKKAWIRY